MKRLIQLPWFALIALVSGCASSTTHPTPVAELEGTPPEFSERLVHFQIDKAAPEAKAIGSLVFQVQKVGSISADMDPGFLVVLANSVVLASDFKGLKKGDVFVAEFPEMAAALDQAILYPNQIESGDVITIAVTSVGPKRIAGFWREKKRANQSPEGTPVQSPPSNPGQVSGVPHL